MIASRLPSSCLVAASLLALAGCGSRDDAAEADQGEKAGLGLAVAPPMMVDPDLTSRNQAGAALAGGGPPVILLPPVPRGSEDIAAAKAEADKLAGGSAGYPPTSEGDPDAALRDSVTAAQRAGSIKGLGKDCGGKADYALGWSIKLPAALPIYPRGNLLEAAGSDRDGCALRVVRFVTPVDPEALIAFYNARARKAGISIRYRADEDTFQLSGAKGQGAFAVQARRREDGLTEADIVVNGI